MNKSMDYRMSASGSKAFLKGLLYFQVDLTVYTRGNDIIFGSFNIQGPDAWTPSIYFNGLVTSLDPRGAPIPTKDSPTFGDAAIITMRDVQVQPPYHGREFHETTLYIFMSDYLIGQQIIGESDKHVDFQPLYFTL
jgi:hypothetical protein